MYPRPKSVRAGVPDWLGLLTVASVRKLRVREREIDHGVTGLVGVAGVREPLALDGSARLGRAAKHGDDRVECCGRENVPLPREVDVPRAVLVVLVWLSSLGPHVVGALCVLVHPLLVLVAGSGGALVLAANVNVLGNGFHAECESSGKDFG